MITLDNVVDTYKINKINWIKIDVEGAEEKAIIGGLKSISKFKTNMIIECHNFLDPQISNRVKQLITSSFDCNFEEIERHPCTMLYITPKGI